MNIYLYVLPTLADWEIGYITAELHSGRFLDKNIAPITIIKAGATKDPIRTMGGMEITPDEQIDAVSFKEGDVLILPGADTWMDSPQQGVLAMIPDLLRKKVVIAAICGATMALAQQGILNARAHTSNDKGLLKMMCPAYTGDQYYKEMPAVTDDDLITATGLAPLEFAYEIFKKTGVMKKTTAEAWYRLYSTRQPESFYQLMESLK